MEDNSSLLWVLFAAGAFIYSAIQRKQEAAKKRQRQAQKEAWPTTIPTETAPATDSDKSAEETVFPTEYRSLEEIPEQEYDSADLAPVSAETIPAETPVAYAPARHPAATSSLRGPKAYKTDREVGDMDSDAIDPKPSDTSESTQADDFDLQQAVIYSEILKPKFHDGGEW